MAVLDVESYCPTILSIDIDDWGCNESISDVSQVENNLSIFFSHCHNLQAVNMRVIDDMMDRYPKSFSDIVMSVLVEKLRENSLISMSFVESCQRHSMAGQLLSKHASSLRDLTFDFTNSTDVITPVLIENQIHLRLLVVNISFDFSRPSDFLLSYISSTGDLLEVLEINCGGGGLIDLDALINTVSTSCPKLTRFAMSNGELCSIESLRHLYEQCPHLQSVFLPGVIEIDEEKRSVSIEVRSSNDDWAVCLSLAFRRRQYKQVRLILREVYYHPVENLKSLLQSSEIHLESTTSEATLITMLQDLPHLGSLRLVPLVNSNYTEATVEVIAKHAKSLTKLDVESTYTDQNHFLCFDKLLSKLIRRCQLLTRLTISACGLESLMTISEHSNLRVIDLTIAENVSEEMVQEYLLDEKVMWPATLEEGLVDMLSPMCKYYYIFCKESHHWVI
eukprot:scaffold1206_cov184-Ochromonas_danica.AAC.9